MPHTAGPTDPSAGNIAGTRGIFLPSPRFSFMIRENTAKYAIRAVTIIVHIAKMQKNRPNLLTLFV